LPKSDFSEESKDHLLNFFRSPSALKKVKIITKKGLQVMKCPLGTLENTLLGSFKRFWAKQILEENSVSKDFPYSICGPPTENRSLFMISEDLQGKSFKTVVVLKVRRSSDCLTHPENENSQFKSNPAFSIRNYQEGSQQVVFHALSLWKIEVDLSRGDMLVKSRSGFREVKSKINRYQFAKSQ